MKISIEKVSNGFLLEYKEAVDEQEGIFVKRKIVIEEFDGEVKALKSLFQEIENLVGNSSGKRSEERLYLTVAPGHDHPNFKGLDWDYESNTQIYSAAENQQ